MASIIDQEPFNEYTGNGVSTVYPYTFHLLSADDLVVTVDLVETTAFTLSGVGVQSGGEVTFTTAPANLSNILISRRVSLSRDTDYQYNGELRESTLDRDLNRLWQALQDGRADTGGAIRATYPIQLSALPGDPADYPGYFIGLDVSGNPTYALAPSGTAADVVTRLASTDSPSDGAGMVGFKQSGTGAVPRTAMDKMREVVSVKDFGAVGDGVTDDTAAIQAAFDSVFLAGSGTVLVEKASDRYQISDTLTIRANTRVVFESAVELTTASSTGTVLYLTGNNIELVNPLVNGGGDASDAGENGIGIVSGNNIQIRGGKVEDCYRGGVGDMFGGKGVQIESGGVGGVLVDGLQFSNCFMAMSTVRDGLNASPDSGILFTNIKADACEILFFVKQSNINNTNGLEHTVQLNNFFALNCGAFEGVMQFSRASNVQVSNGIVINSNAVVTTPLIRGNHRFCSFGNIRFSGDCSSIISLDPSTFAADSSYTCENNAYDIKHSGLAGYVAHASIATTNRILVDSKIAVNLDSDVSTKIVGDELRNGYCELVISHGGRTISTTTSTFYLEGRSTVALYSAGMSMPRINASHITFPAAQISSGEPNTLDDYEEGVWTPIDSSGASLSFTTAYGDFTKIGRLVCASFTVTFPITANASVVSLGALPFQAQNVGGRATGALAMRYTDQGALMSGTIDPGASAMSLAFGTGALVTNANMSGKSISGVITYMAAT